MLGTESEKGDVAFSLRWGMPLHWSCSDMQPERPRERWVWGSQWANCTPNALPSGKWQPRWLSTCWASLPGSSKVELRPLLWGLCSDSSISYTHCESTPSRTVHSPRWGCFSPALSRHGEGLAASPMLVTFMSLPGLVPSLGCEMNLIILITTGTPGSKSPSHLYNKLYTKSWDWETCRKMKQSFSDTELEHSFLKTKY